MIKKFCILSLFIMSFMLHAQKTKVIGTVSDSLGNPLALANVIATHKADSSVVGFAIANREGQYRIGLVEGKTYVLTASFMGMNPVKKVIEITKNSQDLSLDFHLKPNPNQLQGVELVYEIPVVVKGDTIVYNTDSFTNGNEEKLGDVLEKLPGFEVSDEGDVKVEGKKVTKLMVEGKEFFGGNTRLGTKNIPSNAVDKVEVLRDYNEVQQLDGVTDNRESVALNIKLKEGKKKFWFGNVKAGTGKGKGNRYLGNIRLFRYGPKTTVNLIGNLNNVGEVPFTFMDYFNFIGGFEAFDGGNTKQLGSGLGAILQRDERVKASENDFVAANFTTNLSDSWGIGAFLIYSANQTRFESQSSQDYVQNQIREETQGRRSLDDHLGLFKFNADFVPSKQFQIKYDVLVKTSNFEQYAHATTIFYEGTDKTVNPITENNADSPSSVRQNMNIYYTLNEKNIFAGYFQHTYQEGNPFYRAQVENRPFSGIFPLDTQEGQYDLRQHKGLTTTKFDGKIDYYWVMNDQSHLNFSVGLTRGRQDLNSAIYQGMDAGKEMRLTGNEFSNVVAHDFQNAYFGVNYKLLTGIFTFSPGLSVHNYYMQTEQNLGKIVQNNTFLLPEFSVVAEFQESESLRLTYQMKADFPDVEQLAEGYVLKNYNLLFLGNPTLENGLSHRLSLRYRRFNMFNFTNTNFHIRYNRKMNSLTNNFILAQINRVSSPVNSDFPTENLTFGGSFQKTFRKFRADVDADIHFGKYTSLVNQEAREVNTFGQTYTFSLKTNFDHFPNAEVGYEQQIDQYDNASLKKVYYTGRLFLETDINFLKNFTFSTDFSYYNYTDKAKTIRNHYSFLSAALVYESPNNHWEFSLEGTNLLNVEAIYREGVTTSYNYQTTYFVQPRILLFSVNYKL